MSNQSIDNDVVFSFWSLPITNTVLTTWGLIIFIMFVTFILTKSLKQLPTRKQTIAEGIVATIEAAIAEVIPATSVRQVLPFVATLWLFVLVANLVGLIPGLHSPTRDLSTTAALAALVFISTHWFGIRSKGLRNYLKHYAEPSIILLPFHVISELTRTLALAIRLFGNMMSLEMAALLILVIAGFLIPIPILMLHIIEALVQAYIFGILALIYIAGAIEPNESESAKSLSNQKENT
ncbi:MAG TPA: F0F1 ATP synthase subunit A [Methylophilaceae bacterium]|nr:F0F1 ATP synthase subunit A [Methylophilaceae bacterium]